MINLQELVDYCLSKKDSYIDFPFGDIPVCIKYEKHIFAEIYPEEDDYKITLRCDPLAGDYYRSKYPGIVIPGYHVPLRQRKYKNTVLLNCEISFAVVMEMIDHSYNTLCKKGKKH